MPCSVRATSPSATPHTLRTPAAIVRKLHDEFVQALQAPDIRERFAVLGAEPVGSTPEQFAALMREDIVRWAQVVKASGVRLD